MNKTTSLELSKTLKEAGAKQSGESTWQQLTKDVEWKLIKTKHSSSIALDSVRTFDCHELLERLPVFALTGFYPTLIRTIINYRAGYECGTDMLEGSGHEAVFPAEALGKLYLWCLQNRHIKKEKK